MRLNVGNVLYLITRSHTVIDFCMRSDNKVIKQITDSIMQIDYGFASAMTWIYFVIVIAFVGISSLIISRGVYYYD